MSGPLFGDGQQAAAGRPAAVPGAKCSSCGLWSREGHADDAACIKALKRNAALLVEKLPAKHQACRACRAVIVMVETRDEHTRGGLAWKPYDLNGQSHFISCPNRDQFTSR